MTQEEAIAIINARVAEAASLTVSVGEAFGSIGLAARNFDLAAIPDQMALVENYRAQRDAKWALIEAAAAEIEDVPTREAQLLTAAEQIAEYPPG